MADVFAVQGKYGFVLLHKRLESGSFQWPWKESEARALTTQQYRWLMEGLSVDQPKAHKPVKWAGSGGKFTFLPYASRLSFCLQSKRFLLTDT